MLVLIPFTSSLSFTSFFLLLLSLLILSILHRPSRLTIATLLSISLAFQLLRFIVPYLSYAFKAVAWFGFYMHFFWLACTMVYAAVVWLFDDALPWVVAEMDRERVRNN